MQTQDIFEDMRPKTLDMIAGRVAKRALELNVESITEVPQWEFLNDEQKQRAYELWGQNIVGWED